MSTGHDMCRIQVISFILLLLLFILSVCLVGLQGDAPKVNVNVNITPTWSTGARHDILWHPKYPKQIENKPFGKEAKDIIVHALDNW